MAKLQEQAEVIATRQGVEIMAKHFLIAAIWSEKQEGTKPNASKQAQLFAIEATRKFIVAIGADMFNAIKAAHANGYGTHPDNGTVQPWCAAMGHDLWLTRNGHGVGFWERDELKPELGEILTVICRDQGEIHFEQYRGWVYLR